MEGNFIYIVILIGISITIYYSTAKTTLRNILLLFSSLIFYYVFEGNNIIILLVIILLSFLTGKLLHQYNYKKSILLGGIFINVLLLLAHKYIIAVNSYQNISLPIGLSFYTFQSISYIVDVYRKKDNVKLRFTEVAVFIAFFPKLLAGPLERADSFVLELRKRKFYNGKRIFTAIKIIIYALVCKFVFADNIGMYVDSSLLDYRYLSSMGILITAALFSFQIFFDFYAYSTLAIGIAKLYGVKLSYNFNYPYFSSSFRDFWKRWNITLTSWFKSYIYIPLGGNKVSDLRWIINVLVVFLISGIWHGATFNFIVWGFLHGILYISERYIYRYLPVYYKENKIIQFLYCCFVFMLLSLLWLIFRVEDFTVLSSIFKQLFLFSSWDVNIKMVGWLIFVILLMIFLKKYQIIEKFILRTKDLPAFILKEILLLNLLTILLLFFSTSGKSSFIYFKF